MNDAPAPMTEAQSEAALQTIQTMVGSERVSMTEADRTLHARDQSAYAAHLPDLVVWPHSSKEVSDILAYAHLERIPVVGWGAGTSLEGNPIPVHGGIVINFQQMNQILEIHSHDFQVTVQAGVLYKDMNQQLARHGLFFAPDPGANASIGGMIANNAAGIRTVKYGATRDNVLALELVLANGEILRTGSRAVKQSSGYDLTHLFVGSEGTLGLITEATLKLAPLPEHFSAVTVAFPTVTEAAEAVFSVMGSGLEPAALELVDEATVALLNAEENIQLTVAPHLFMEFNGASEMTVREALSVAEEICLECHGQDFRTGIGREARNRLWAARHHLFETVVRHHPGQSYLLTDVAVPISQYPTLVATANEFIAELGLRCGMVGHAGDGNMHTIIFFAPEDTATRDKASQFNDRLVEAALALGGTSTGEHGVGLGKKKYMLQEHGPVALALMRRLKSTLDPNNILNPGKVLA